MRLRLLAAQTITRMLNDSIAIINSKIGPRPYGMPVELCMPMPLRKQAQFQARSRAGARSGEIRRPP